MADQLIPGAEPRYIAAPEVTDAPGIVLLHDLGDTPQELEPLAQALGNKGYTVELPLLPGHGTHIADLAATTWEDWAGASQLVLDELVGRAGPVVVGGIGLGATLAAWIALDRPEVAGLIAINPRATPIPEEANDVMRAMLADGTSVVPPLAPDVSDRTAKVLGYDSIPVRTLMSMFSGVNELATHWADIKCPILLVSSARDHRVHPVNSEWVRDHASSPVELVELKHSFHLATLDVEHVDLEHRALDFVHRVTS